MSTALTVLADTWGMHDGDVGWGWMVLMMGVMILFWGGIILGIVWLARGGSEGWHWRGERQETPSDILERRFAEGAISVEDYKERREVIGTGAGDFQQPAGDDRAAGGTRGSAE